MDGGSKVVPTESLLTPAQKEVRFSIGGTHLT